MQLSKDMIDPWRSMGKEGEEQLGDSESGHPAHSCAKCYKHQASWVYRSRSEPCVAALPPPGPKLAGARWNLNPTVAGPALLQH